MIIRFSVSGTPRPKQSVKKGQSRKTGKAVYYTPARIKEWQNEVAWRAKEAMGGTEPVADRLFVILHFWLPDNRRRDLDNLSKGVLDGCNKIVWNDDQQIKILVLIKDLSEDVGVDVLVSDSIDLDTIVQYLQQMFDKGE